MYRDWHLGSKDTVFDLVHPSLFPVVYGRTTVLSDSVVDLDDCVKRCGDGVTLRVPPRLEAQQAGVWTGGLQDDHDPYSRQYQWLPCDVGFEVDSIKITSYIDNLHPQTHKPLYEVIERIVELTIPLWNQTLTLPDYNSPRVNYSECEYDPDPDSFPEEEQSQQLPNKMEENYWERKDRWVRDTKWV